MSEFLKDDEHHEVTHPEGMPSKAMPAIPASKLEGMPSVEDEDPRAQRDKLLHWWCNKKLHRYLRKLSKLPEANIFREPLPWKELGLLDYEEVVKKPCDFKTISEKLDAKRYDDEEGFLDPDAFWEDVFLCFDNVRQYFHSDPEVEAVEMAEVMTRAAEDLEDEFWQELQQFEQEMNWDEMAQRGQELAGHVYEEGVATVEYIGQQLAFWWNGYDDRPASPPVDDCVELSKLDVKSTLRVHFMEAMRVHCKEDGTKDMDAVEDKMLKMFKDRWPQHSQELDLEETALQQSRAFPGREKIIQIERLVPPSLLAEKVPAGRLRRGYSNRVGRAHSAASSRSAKSSASSRAGGFTPRLESSTTPKSGSTPRTDRTDRISLSRSNSSRGALDRANSKKLLDLDNEKRAEISQQIKQMQKDLEDEETSRMMTDVPAPKMSMPAALLAFKKRGAGK